MSNTKDATEVVETETPETESASRSSHCSPAIGKCTFCGDVIVRGVVHACDESETEFAVEPFYVVGTNRGLALRDAKSRCMGVLTFRPWMSAEAMDRVSEKIISMFPRT